MKLTWDNQSWSESTWPEIGPRSPTLDGQPKDRDREHNTPGLVIALDTAHYGELHATVEYTALWYQLEMDENSANISTMMLHATV